MKKLIFIVILFCYVFTTKAQPNLILNGSFELNNSTICHHAFYFANEYNNTFQYSIHYGDINTIVLIKGSCFSCSPPVYWGGKKEIIC